MVLKCYLKFIVWYWFKGFEIGDLDEEVFEFFDLFLVNIV